MAAAAIALPAERARPVAPAWIIGRTSDLTWPVAQSGYAVIVMTTEKAG